MTVVTNVSPESSPSQGFNLLKLRPVRALVLWAGFPYVFQGVILALFLYLALLGWGRFPPEGVAAKDYAKTNLVNLLIWGLWWPGMVWLVVLFGRVWCAVCPLELVANGTERLGRRLGLKQAALGKWLRSGALIVAVYGLIQLLVAGADLHRIPAYTSIFLWTMLAAAALVGLMMKDRAVCRGFCPVGLLLATYARGSMLVVRPMTGETCRDCAEKDCRTADNRYRLDARSCPSLLNPAKLKGNTDCLICGQCIKACGPKDNLGLFLRRPFHPADARQMLASWPVTLFVFLVSGFVAYELCSEWKAAQAAFNWVPVTLAGTVGLSSYAGWVKGIWMLSVVPLALWLVLGGTVVLLGGAGGLSEAWRRLALPMAVVIAAGQMAKGVAKTASWAGYLPLALSQPAGTENALAMAAGTLSKPRTLMPLSVVSVISLVLIFVAVYYALRESRLADPKTHRSRIAALWILGLASAFLVLGWGFLQ